MTRPDSAGPTVLVTGASGLIGSRLVHEFARDHRVVAMDRIDPGEEHPASSIYVPVDLTSDESTERAVREMTAQCGDEVASIVHLAAYYDFSGEPSPLYQDLTVDGTRRLLRALRCSTRTSQFVFVSSLLAMKPAEIWRIRERKLESVLFPGDRSSGQAFVHLDDAVRSLRDEIQEMLTRLEKDPETWYRENGLPDPEEAPATLTRAAPTGTERPSADAYSNERR